MRPTLQTALLVAYVVALALALATPARAVVVQAQFEIPAESFDQWVFQNNGNSGQARKRLLTLLDLRIADVDAECELTDQQKLKLQIAGKIDVRRFYDRVAEAREEFMKVRLDQEAFNNGNIWQKIQPLQQEIANGLFREKSFYEKVLANTLDSKQQGAYAKVDAARRRFTYEAKIRMTIANMESAVPMTEAQREKLVALLLETTPPLAFGPYDHYYVMYQCSRLPEKEIETLFAGPQLRAFKQAYAQGQNLRAHLEQQGVLPDEQ